jgi:carbon storage regulator
MPKAIGEKIMTKEKKTIEEEKTITNLINESKGLILSRRKGEKITIGKSVQIEVIDYGRGSVTLAIKAPKNIPVHRKEVLDAIAEQNQQAAKQNVSVLKQALTNIKLDTNITEQIKT